MKKRQAKLQLHRETVRALTQRDLERAAGGSFNTELSSWTSCDMIARQASCEICPLI